MRNHTPSPPVGSDRSAPPTRTPSDRRGPQDLLDEMRGGHTSTVARIPPSTAVLPPRWLGGRLARLIDRAAAALGLDYLAVAVPPASLAVGVEVYACAARAVQHDPDAVAALDAALDAWLGRRARPVLRLLLRAYPVVDRVAATLRLLDGERKVEAGAGGPLRVGGAAEADEPDWPALIARFARAYGMEPGEVLETVTWRAFPVLLARAEALHLLETHRAAVAVAAGMSREAAVELDAAVEEGAAVLLAPKYRRRPDALDNVASLARLAQLFGGPRPHPGGQTPGV